MMGRQPQSQEKLFYTGFNLSQRIPKNHILRKITNMVEFDFVYKEEDLRDNPIFSCQ